VCRARARRKRRVRGRARARREGQAREGRAGCAQPLPSPLGAERGAGPGCGVLREGRARVWGAARGTGPGESAGCAGPGSGAKGLARVAAQGV
jgi:hypothetical protein